MIIMLKIMHRELISVNFADIKTKSVQADKDQLSMSRAARALVGQIKGQIYSNIKHLLAERTNKHNISINGEQNSKEITFSKYKLLFF